MLRENILTTLQILKNYDPEDTVYKKTFTANEVKDILDKPNLDAGPEKIWIGTCNTLGNRNLKKKLKSGLI